jgi:hypothetical protein
LSDGPLKDDGWHLLDYQRENGDGSCFVRNACQMERIRVAFISHLLGQWLSAATDNICPGCTPGHPAYSWIITRFFILYGDRSDILLEKKAGRILIQ